jgi:hypothetical protein
MGQTMTDPRKPSREENLKEGRMSNAELEIPPLPQMSQSGPRWAVTIAEFWGQLAHQGLQRSAMPWVRAYRNNQSFPNCQRDET